MAEKSVQTPTHFATYVVADNLLEFQKNPSSLKSAFNCVMSIDALAAQIFVCGRDEGLFEHKDDTAFRQELAQENANFKLIRDVAKSFKHVALDRGDPIVRRATQAHVGRRPYGEGLYGVGTFAGEEVMLEVDEEKNLHLLSVAIEAFEFLEEKIKEESYV